jgi:hypothetical protein
VCDRLVLIITLAELHTVNVGMLEPTLENLHGICGAQNAWGYMECLAENRHKDTSLILTLLTGPDAIFI